MLRGKQFSQPGLPLVMAGRDPAIHGTRREREAVDARDEPAHDASVKPKYFCGST
jgi:hypothetical protein